MNKNNKSTLRRIIATLGMVLMLSLSLTGMTQPAQAMTSSTAVAAAVAPSLSVSTQTVKFGGQSSSTTVTVSNAQSYSVSVSKNWIHASKSGNKITIQVDANNTGLVREGTVTVTSGSQQRTISVSQHKKLKVYAGSGYTSEVTLRVFVGVANFIDPPQETFKVDSSTSFSATPSSSWLSVTTSGSYITIKATPNTTQEQRRGYVKISNGYETVDFQIIQQAIVPYKMTLYPYIGPTSFNPSSSLKNAYRELKVSGWNALSISEQRQHISNLVTAAKSYLNVTKSATVYYDTRAALNSQYASILGNDKITANENGRTMLKNGSLYFFFNADKLGGDYRKAATTVLHEVRHSWQMTNAKYGGTMMQWLCKYNLEHYISTPFEDYEAQFVEKDARYYASYLESTLFNVTK